MTNLFNDIVSLSEENAQKRRIQERKQLIITRNGDYVVDPSMDDIGLPAESPFYVKKNCKKCYGRGYQIFVAPKGFKVEEVEVSRQYIGCACQNKTYNAMRFAIQKFEPDQQALVIEDLKTDLKAALDRLFKLGTKYFDVSVDD